jgi:hypothetical protein
MIKRSKKAEKVYKKKKQDIVSVGSSLGAGATVGTSAHLYNKYKIKQALKNAPQTEEEAVRLLKNIVEKNVKPGDILIKTNLQLAPDAGPLHPVMFLNKKKTLDVYPAKVSDSEIKTKTKAIRKTVKVANPFHLESAKDKIGYYIKGGLNNRYTPEDFSGMLGIYRVKDTSDKQRKNIAKRFLAFARKPEGTFKYGTGLFKSRRKDTPSPQKPMTIHCTDILCETITGKRSFRKGRPDALLKQLEPVWKNPSHYTRKAVVGPALAAAGLTTLGFKINKKLKNKDKEVSFAAPAALTTAGVLATIPKIRKPFMPVAGVSKILATKVFSKTKELLMLPEIKKILKRK